MLTRYQQGISKYPDSELKNFCLHVYCDLSLTFTPFAVTCAYYFDKQLEM
jgi:hypothetical protein